MHNEGASPGAPPTTWSDRVASRVMENAKRRAPLVLLSLAATSLLGACGQESPSLVRERVANAISDADASASHERMRSELAEIARRAPVENKYFGNIVLRQRRASLEALSADAEPGERWAAWRACAQAETYQGSLETAIALLEDARNLERKGAVDVSQADSVETLMLLGIAHLRVAETAHCIAHRNPSSCVFPIEAEGVHGDPAPALRAAQEFERILDLAPDDLVARWLLNLSAMVAGQYPDAVPDQWRIPAAALSRGAAFPRFHDVAGRVGVATVSLAGGAVVEDLNGDGLLDLLVSDWHPEGSLRLLCGAGDGTFEDRSQSAGLAGIHGGLNMLHADYDDDGDVDVLVLRGAWMAGIGRQPNSLLRNDGRGHFVDVAHAAGIAGTGLDFPTQTATWSDLDLDGDLDLFVGNETDKSLWAPCQLFVNRGDGTFVEQGEQAGLTNQRWTKAVSAGDVNGDGLPDVFISNLGAPNRLLVNRGDLHFEDVTDTAGVSEPFHSFPAWFWDANDDGALDLFVAGYGSDWKGTEVAVIAADYLGLPHDGVTPRLYLGDGSGGFSDATPGSGLEIPSFPMGANYGDLDNDGRLDVYLGTGEPPFKGLMPNMVFRNRDGMHFEDVTIAGGFGNLQKGHAVVLADLDSDGDLDVFGQMGGSAGVDVAADVLLENPGTNGAWLIVRAVGVRSNRSAIGTRLTARFTDAGTSRQAVRHVGTGGSFGASPLRVHLGLGAAVVVDELEVHWPASGVTQVFTDVPVGAFVEVVEGEDEFRSLPYARVRLGGER